MSMKRGHFILLVVLAFIHCRTVLADEGPDKWIFSLEQQGQDVAVRLYGGVDRTCTLLRRNGQGEHEVIRDEVLTAEYLDDDVRCDGVAGHAEYCADYPDRCIDCDGDDIDECATKCRHFMMIVDECVPAGDTRYIFRIVKDYLEEDSATIKVRDVGVDCSGTDSDTDTDTDTDTDAGADPENDSDDDESGQDDDSPGCSVSMHGSVSGHGILLFLLMLATGLFAAFRMRDR